MIGGIAGQGGFDSKGKNINIARAETNSTSYALVCSVTGSGYILGISQAGSASTMTSIQIIIDGVTKIDTQLSNSSYSTEIALPLFIKFNTSFVINHKASANYTQTAVSYLLD